MVLLDRLDRKAQLVLLALQEQLALLVPLALLVLLVQD
jgi:hypothetical protein